MLTSSYDKRISIYNLDHVNNHLAECSWETTDGVEDVKWSNFNSHVFASAHQEDKINLWDIRLRDKATSIRKAHNGEVYSVDFNYKT